jgi:hypothetical protein
MEEDMPNFDALITTKELAKKMGSSAAWVRHLAESGKIPYLRISERNFRFDLVKVYRALERQISSSEAPAEAASNQPLPAPAAKPDPSPRPVASSWGKPNPRRDRR